MQTELGKIAHSIGERPASKTQLQKQLEQLALGLFLFAIILGVVVVGVNGWKCDYETILYATALAVAMIPESLVSVVTLTMAIGVKRLAAANTIVRRLTALEALGTFLLPSLPPSLPPTHGRDPFSPCFVLLTPSFPPSLPPSLPPCLSSPRHGD
jgi:Kef-type K+ transport system membrane component KefB